MIIEKIIRNFGALNKQESLFDHKKDSSSIYAVASERIRLLTCD